MEAEICRYCGEIADNPVWDQDWIRTGAPYHSDCLDALIEEEVVHCDDQTGRLEDEDSRDPSLFW